MSFKVFAKELTGSRVEGELITSVFYALVASIVLLALLYVVKLRFIPDLFPKYGLFLFLATLSYSFIVPSMRQVRAYKEMLCMTGMMIGMTTGMIAGFLSGFFVAATNGMFVGSVFGMLVGITLGVWNGKCCGIMGIMEGLMAGFMGGLMGAMTAFMLLNDHLRIMSVIVFVISVGILIGLNYLIFQETKESERERKEDYVLIIVIAVLLTALTTWLMVLGPKTGVFA